MLRKMRWALQTYWAAFWTLLTFCTSQPPDNSSATPLALIGSVQINVSQSRKLCKLSEVQLALLSGFGDLGKAIKKGIETIESKSK